MGRGPRTAVPRRAHAPRRPGAFGAGRIGAPWGQVQRRTLWPSLLPGRSAWGARSGTPPTAPGPAIAVGTDSGEHAVATERQRNRRRFKSAQLRSQR